MKYSQSAYNKTFDLYMKYGPIVVRPTTQDTKALDELVRMCDTEEKYSLIDELLSRFYYMNDDDYQKQIIGVR